MVEYSPAVRNPPVMAIMNAAPVVFVKMGTSALRRRLSMGLPPLPPQFLAIHLLLNDFSSHRGQPFSKNPQNRSHRGNAFFQAKAYNHSVNSQRSSRRAEVCHSEKIKPMPRNSRIAAKSQNRHGSGPPGPVWCPARCARAHEPYAQEAVLRASAQARCARSCRQPVCLPGRNGG